MHAPLLVHVWVLAREIPCSVVSYQLRDCLPTLCTWADSTTPDCCICKQLCNSCLLVRQVCDQPHPLLVAEVVRHCQAAALDEAWKGLEVC